MTIDTLVYVFEVRYTNRPIQFIRIENRDDALDLAWKVVTSRVEGLSNVISISFLHVERKY